MASKPRKTAVKRPTFVPYVQRIGTPVAMPLFGPASLTREAAQERIDQAMKSGNFVADGSRIEQA